MARLRCTARKSVIPFLPSRLAEHPLCRTVPGQSRCLERLYRRLHKEQEQQDSSPSPQQEVETRRLPSPAPQPEMPLHYHRASLLLTETTTTPVSVRATTQSLRSSRSQKDGSPDPSLMMPLTVVISTMLSTPCCVGHSTDILGLSSTVV